MADTYRVELKILDIELRDEFALGYAKL